MKRVPEICVFVALLSFATTATAQSLGEVARQERARKGSSPQSARRVYTDADFSKPNALLASESEPAKDSRATDPNAPGKPNSSAQELQSKIRDKKQGISELEARIQAIEQRLDQRESIGVEVSQRVISQSRNVGPGACALSKAMYTDPYKDWCDEPAKLAAELEKNQSELKEARTNLEGLQEKARKMGFGSAFYDPE